MPPVSPKSPTPSQASNHVADTHLFLSDRNSRKLYLKLINSTQRVFKISASIWFLEKCIEGKLIPKTFRIRNKPTSPSDTTSSDWNATSLKSSLEYMKIAVEKEREREKDAQDTLTSEFNVLMLLCPNDTVREEIRTRMVSRGQKFRTQEMMKKEKQDL